MLARLKLFLPRFLKRRVVQIAEATDGTPYNLRRLQRLLKHLDSKSEDQRQRAEATLYKIYSPDDRPKHWPSGPYIISAIESQRISDAFYSNIRGTEAVLPLLEALKSGGVHARCFAAHNLGAIKDSRAVPLLVDALKSDSPKVREAAATGLCYFAKPSTLDVLLYALNDPEQSVRSSAAQALGRIGDVKASQPLLKLLASENNTDKCSGLYALAEIGDRETLPVIREYLRHKSSHVRSSARSALAAFDRRRRRALQDSRSNDTPAE